MHKPLTRQIKEKKKMTQIISIRIERGDSTTDSIFMERMIKEYHKLLYTNKYDNLDHAF